MLPDVEDEARNAPHASPLPAFAGRGQGEGQGLALSFKACQCEARNPGNRARVLRSRMTSAEGKLWYHLRGRRLDGVKFVRQTPVGPYFVDFLCRELKVIVEIDVATHSTDAEKAYDEKRAAYLENSGH